MSHNQHAYSLTNQYSIYLQFTVYILVHLKRLGNISNLNVVNISGGLGDQIVPDPSVVTNTAQPGGDLGHAGGSPDLNIGQFLLQFPCIGMTTMASLKEEIPWELARLRQLQEAKGLAQIIKGGRTVNSCPELEIFLFHLPDLVLALGLPESGEIFPLF